MVVLKELILTVLTLGCDHPERTGEGVVVLKELIFNSFSLWEGVVVLKELIFNSFYFWRVWWS